MSAWAALVLAAFQSGLGSPVQESVTIDRPVLFEGLDTVLDGDSKIFQLRSPTFLFGRREIRATWALLWTDKEQTSFLDLSDSEGLRVAAPAVEQADPTADAVGFNSFDELLSEPRLEPVRELYLEGPVEFFEGGQRVGSADALYIDRVEGHGWLSNARIEVRDRIGGSRFVLKVTSNWLRISADGSLVSDNARVTTCEHADPHYEIKTTKLRMEPTGDPNLPWRVKMSGNAIQIGDWFKIPLPPINYIADEEGEPALENLRFGESGQFGPSVGFGYSRDVETYGSTLDRLLKGDEGGRFDSKFRVDVDYLGSRGLLLDLSLRLTSEDRYRSRTDFAFIPDGDEDRGLVEVPEDQRDTLRTWLRSRSRFFLGEDEWLELVVSDQSDPGVQAEFFEREYLDFEERETFVHWRKAWGANYASASAVTTLDEFQTQVEELPELEYVRQRTSVLETDAAPLVYSSATEAGWYRRQEGDPFYEAPFADGFGEQSTWRFDSEHRFEAPVELGVAGARLIPFATARWTGWSEAGAGEDMPARTLVTGGARLVSTFWRRTARGGIQELSPLIGWSADAVTQQTGGEPLFIDDDTEDLLTGRFVDLGLRGRSRGEWLFGTPFAFDGEARTRWGTELDTGAETRWLPLELLGELETKLGPVPVRLYHDTRLDTEDRQTDYSRTNLSFDPIPRMTVNLAFATGRDTDGVRLYEAANFGGSYRFSPKWELEGQQTLNLETNNSLDARGTIRRYGHDLIFELTVARRSGEGGSSIGFRIKPAVTARRRPEVPTSSFVQRW